MSLQSGAWIAVDATDYHDDKALRYDINRAYRSARLDVTDAPVTFGSG